MLSRRNAPLSKRAVRRLRATFARQSTSSTTSFQVCGSCSGMGIGSSPSLAVKSPSMMRCACSYASLTQERMTVRPSHCDSMLPSGVMSHTAENARRSTPGLRLHSSWHSRCGSIGMTRCTRYTLVQRDAASSSNAVSGLTKWVTSAMCTPMRSSPLSSRSTLSASSRSRAVRGSMVKTRTDLKSRLASISVWVTSQGLSGRQSITSWEKSASSMPSAARMAAVSVSISPAWPIDSRTCASGVICPASHATRRADTRWWGTPAGLWQSSVSCATSCCGRVCILTIMRGMRGSDGTSVAMPLASDMSEPITRSRRAAFCSIATTRPRGRILGLASRNCDMLRSAASGLPAASDTASVSSPLSSVSVSTSSPLSFSSIPDVGAAPASPSASWLSCSYHCSRGRMCTATSSPTTARFWSVKPLMSTSTGRPTTLTYASVRLLALQRNCARKTAPVFMPRCRSAWPQCSLKRPFLVRAFRLCSSAPDGVAFPAGSALDCDCLRPAPFGLGSRLGMSIGGCSCVPPALPEVCWDCPPRLPRFLPPALSARLPPGPTGPARPAPLAPFPPFCAVGFASVPPAPLSPLAWLLPRSACCWPPDSEASAGPLRLALPNRPP
mmetsp:Transcript_11210/g.28759  ORF Transcript_11210/g.28759 Transcript_11210/m.28759 type:complete len:612 (+) Transcript_11210:353-2188(+)